MRASARARVKLSESEEGARERERKREIEREVEKRKERETGRPSYDGIREPARAKRTEKESETPSHGLEGVDESERDASQERRESSGAPRATLLALLRRICFSCGVIDWRVAAPDAFPAWRGIDPLSLFLSLRDDLNEMTTSAADRHSLIDATCPFRCSSFPIDGIQISGERETECTEDNYNFCAIFPWIGNFPTPTRSTKDSTLFVCILTVYCVTINIIKYTDSTYLRFAEGAILFTRQFSSSMNLSFVRFIAKRLSPRIAPALKPGLSLVLGLG